MTELSLGTCTPRQVREFTVDAAFARLVPFIHGSPGIGKSAIVRSIAEEYGLELIDFRLSQATPEDLQGLPRFRDIKDKDGSILRTISEFIPFNVFPTESTPLPKGKEGWLLFLDEVNAASKSVQAAMYKLVLDKMVGQEKLHPRVIIVCAGNLATDRAIVNPMSTATQSRLIHLQMELNNDEFLKDVVYKFGWDWRIAAYLSYKPKSIYDFRPDHNDKTFCCPRTWEFMNRLVDGKEIESRKVPLYSGTITSGVASDFVQFTKVQADMLTIKDILSDPNGIELPTDNMIRWATTSYLTDHVDDKTMKPFTQFMARMSSEFRVMFFRSVMARKPDLRQHPAFISGTVELSKYLHD